MQYLEEFLTAPDQHTIPVRVWRPNHVEQILVITHGLAEYCERYTPFAEWLTDHGIAVIALNLRGHGMDCPDQALGYFADHHGWQLVVDDLQLAIEFVTKEIPNVPITLLGHSMGSFVVQTYLQQYSLHVSQVILLSSNRVNKPKLYASLLLLSFIKFFKGKRATSALVDYLSFGYFNGKFKPNRTKSDWISRDDEQVDAYEADPYCGFSCSLLLWQDFINGMLSISVKSWPADKPVHILSGSHDPVGEFGKGIGKLVDNLKNSGKQLATFKLYEGARHELINESNADEVWNDIKKIIKTGELDIPKD